MNKRGDNNESQEYNNSENNNMFNSENKKPANKKDFRLIAICVSSLILGTVFLVGWAIKNFTIVYGGYCFFNLIVTGYLFTYTKASFRNFLRALICCGVLQAMGLVMIFVMRPFWADFMYNNKEADLISPYIFAAFWGGLLFFGYIIDLFFSAWGKQMNDKAKQKYSKNNMNNNGNNNNNNGYNNSINNNNNVFGEQKNNNDKRNDDLDPFS